MASAARRRLRLRAGVPNKNDEEKNAGELRRLITELTPAPPFC
ncbi:MAG TPA: hypothetical protein VG013_34670 [Gemmataceae bacterium]|jgi:hypothetical protein|nr:hypothetical protein [Gemmataceae bacterium]